MLEIRNLTKTYRAQTAVNDLSFTVPDGQVTGFLGPNGAGKSTTMRMAVGLERPTSGEATFDGVPFRKLDNPGRVVGSLLDATWFHPGRSAYQHLAILADLMRLPETRIEECLEAVGLSGVATKRVGGFSLGMKQRLGVACALMGNPKHVLLDEPVNGLDPEGVHWMRERIRALAADGCAVLVSSHLLSEMELTADRLIVVGKGALIAEGTVEEFLSRGKAGTVEVEVLAEDVFRAVGLLEAEGLRVSVVSGGAGSDASSSAAKKALLRVDGAVADDIARLALNNRLLITGLSAKKVSLEDAFLDTTAGSVVYQAN
ncbi:ABC transporter ATP-binding protein [Corynebacterium vitaeruminis]|uniref:ABC transporter ATP-binding protein n=1 Tax=Corynebacterium vitaeruminis DSM 20294 TaxID=1224164 RepID=W5YBC9_9CORY|nr:ABC transporter ATP-binding protein [Corynebacterium vitaeruminis]AHI23848.1 ABC transporter ATP-binding protein [Corynebacterium vitaeruminis DSM 20294]